MVQLSRLALGSAQPAVQQVTSLFTGLQRPARSADQPPHLASKLQGEQNYTSTLPLGLHGLLQDEVYFYLHPWKYTDWIHVICRMRLACQISMATNTHSKHVTLVAFPRQLWLRERASLLRYKYIASLVVFCCCRFILSASHAERGNVTIPGQCQGTQSMGFLYLAYVKQSYYYQYSCEHNGQKIARYIGRKVHPVTCHEGIEEDLKCSSTLSLTSALHWGGWGMYLNRAFFVTCKLRCNT